MSEEDDDNIRGLSISPLFPVWEVTSSSPFLCILAWNVEISFLSFGYVLILIFPSTIPPRIWMGLVDLEFKLWNGTRNPKIQLGNAHSTANNLHLSQKSSNPDFKEEKAGSGGFCWSDTDYSIWGLAICILYYAPKLRPLFVHINWIYNFSVSSGMQQRFQHWKRKISF